MYSSCVGLAHYRVQRCVCVCVCGLKCESDFHCIHCPHPIPQTHTNKSTSHLTTVQSDDFFFFFWLHVIFEMWQTACWKRHRCEQSCESAQELSDTFICCSHRLDKNNTAHKMYMYSNYWKKKKVSCCH